MTAREKSPDPAPWIGVETELGCLRLGESDARDSAPARVRNHVVLGLRLGEAQSGFLVNGGRLYVDQGDHLEYATAECESVLDLIANDRAGQRLVLRAVRELGLEGHVRFFNNNVDHFTGTTFGCHENYSVSPGVHRPARALPTLLPFLVSRQIFAGAGRVGGHVLPRLRRPSRQGSPPDSEALQGRLPLEGAEGPLSRSGDSPHPSDSPFRDPELRMRERFRRRRLLRPFIWDPEDELASETEDLEEALVDLDWEDSLDPLWGGPKLEPDPTVEFQLSQRADHVRSVSQLFDFKPLLGMRWRGLRYARTRALAARYHILFGESNQMQYAYALKVGTTRLALRAAFAGLVPSNLRLADPIKAVKTISRDLTGRAAVPLANGDQVCAIELQKRYLRVAQEFRYESPETDWILDEWASTLDALARDPMELSDRLDWVAKLEIVRQYRAETGVGPHDDSLHSIDLAYHDIDPERSLHGALVQMKKAVVLVDEDRILDAMSEPPAGTHAVLRGDFVRRHLSGRNTTGYAIDWSGVSVGWEALADRPEEERGNAR